MKINYLAIICFVLFFASCSKTEDSLVPVKADQQESGVLNKKESEKKRECEINGTLNYEYTTAFDISCTSCESGYFSTGNYYGTGKFWPIQNVTSKTKACLSFIIDGGNVVGVHVENQCASFVTSNGDELYLTNDPYDLYVNSTGMAVGTCQFYFAGGTGKYENASGNFQGNVENNLMGQFSVSINGTLCY